MTDWREKYSIGSKWSYNNQIETVIYHGKDYIVTDNGCNASNIRAKNAKYYLREVSEGSPMSQHLKNEYAVGKILIGNSGIVETIIYQGDNYIVTDAGNRTEFMGHQRRMDKISDEELAEYMAKYKEQKND